MPKKVFVDTFAWIALINSRDVFHNQVNQILAQLDDDGYDLMTTEFVLLEVANALSSSSIRNKAVTYIDTLKSLKNITIIPVDTELMQSGWLLFCSRTDKEWSLTDCISFVVMTQKRIIQAFTSDHHFEQAGFIRLIKMY